MLKCNTYTIYDQKHVTPRETFHHLCLKLFTLVDSSFKLMSEPSGPEPGSKSIKWIRKSWVLYKLLCVDQWHQALVSDKAGLGCVVSVCSQLLQESDNEWKKRRDKKTQLWRLHKQSWVIEKREETR